MIDETNKPDAPFLRRWSQRKLAASREAGATTTKATPAIATDTRPNAPDVAKADEPSPAVDPATELPPIDSLTFESDFTAFMKPNITPQLRRDALRKLFSDPRFNVMDGLDVYIDDYGKTVPIPEEMVRQLNHAKFLFDPPKTRVNAQGFVEDVPDEPAVAPAVDTAAADDATAIETADAGERRDTPPSDSVGATALPDATNETVSTVVPSSREQAR